MLRRRITRLPFGLPPPSPPAPFYPSFYLLGLITTGFCHTPFYLFFALLTAAFSTIIAKRKATAKELIAQVIYCDRGKDVDAYISRISKNYATRLAGSRTGHHAGFRQPID